MPLLSYKHQVLWLLATLLIVQGLGFAWHALAQSAEETWTPATNISKSGAASQPIVAVAPDGTLHALWWDAIEGEKYARGAAIEYNGITQTLALSTTWSKSVAVPAIVGSRLTTTNPQTGKVTVSLVAPREPSMLLDARNNVHAFWFDVDNQLLSAMTLGGGWSGSEVLADSALNMDAVADVKGTLHLAYIRTLNTPGNPSGIYYRTPAGGTDWSVPVLVFASLYFRAAKPDQVHVSVAGDGQGNVLITWDDFEQGQSFYSRSTNGGRTWSQPQSVTGSKTALATRARVTATPKGDFFFLWQDTSTGGCGVSQRRSTDGGQTWNAPERVLSGLDRCLNSWSFNFGEGSTLWLVGATATDRTDPSGNTLILAVWDGRAWSQPVDVNVNYRDPTTGKSGGLSCLSVELAGPTAGVIGCSSNGDVWTARNAVELNRLIPAVRLSWSAPEQLLNLTSPANLQNAPALAVDTKGKLYAVLSLSPSRDGPGVALHSAWWNGSKWSLAIPAIRPKAGKADQPSLAIDQQDRLHLVWSGGNSGEIFYSWKYARDAASTLGWSEPVELPAPTAIGSWPHIIADPRGDVLHVVYAAPYNEKRGIYYVRSNDGGSTWLTPTLVYDAAAAGWDSANKPRLALDAALNTLHVAWLRTNLPGGAGPQAVVYARSMDGGQTWSNPSSIAEGTVDWPQVAVGGPGQILLAWNQGPPGNSEGEVLAEAWSQFSATAGGQWTKAASVRGFADLTGPLGLASNGASVSLVGLGRDPGGEATLFYSQWDGQAWSEREKLDLGRNAMAGNTASAAIIPKAGQLAVVMRLNVIAADGTARFDAQTVGRNVVVAPAPAAPPPTFTPLPTALPKDTPTPLPTATPRPQLVLTREVNSGSRNPLSGQSPLMVAGVMAAIIVAGVIVGRIVWTMRR